ncbi:MAG: cytochrome b/b6 domain-containing protein [Pseudomonadota bacterium]
MQTFRYAKSQIAIHWLAAALIVFLLVTGTLVLADLPNTTEKIGNLRIHMILGGLAGLLVIARIILRKRLPASPAAAGIRLAKAGHMALNLVVLLLVVSGVVLSLQSGAFDAVFGAGVLPEDFKQFTPRQIHGLTSRLAMGLIALHVLAALYHQFLVKDNLLSRMGLGARKAESRQ